MLLITLLSPLFGCILCGLFGRYIGVTSSKFIACISIFIAMLGSYATYYQVVFQDAEISLNILPWLTLGSQDINWAFNVDKLGTSMLITVTTISLMVHIWGCGYMAHDPHIQRFFSYLNLFTFFMVVLVTGDSYITVFLGWEGVGVISYLLISFWYTRIAAMKAALSAILLNRVGDCLFVLAMSILLYAFGTLNFATIAALAPYIDTNILTCAMFCLLIAAMAKSAQLGLHAWLLSAMEGPTVVSALLHSSTMVTAGIFLLMRSSFLLEYTPTVLLGILFIGAITTLVAGLIALVSNDIKRVIALSTMSQLGIMMLAIGASAYNLAMYHLLCHSMFKALLFMSAGAIIHSVISESQDLRSYGGFRAFLPLTYSCILIASLSLMALPGLTGYYSKDIIIETMAGTYTLTGFICYWFALTSAILTALYSTRLLYLTFFNTPNAPKFIYYSLHESSSLMLVPMVILAIGSIFCGYFLRDIYLGFGVPFTPLFMHPDTLSLIDTELGLATIYRLLPLIGAISGSVIVLALYEAGIGLPTHTLPVYRFFNQRIMFDQLLNQFIRYGLIIGGQLNQGIDKGLLQILGPKGFWSFTSNISSSFVRLSTGSFAHYALYVLTTLILILLVLYYNVGSLLLLIWTITFIMIVC